MTTARTSRSCRTSPGCPCGWRNTKPIALFAPEAGKPVHVLVACDKEKWAAYRDGRAGRHRAAAGRRGRWEPRELVMGAAWSGADPWRGRMEGDRGVSPCADGRGSGRQKRPRCRALQAGRKPATTVRFKGTLVRQARTSTLEEIRPYTRSLTAAEYKVRPGARRRVDTADHHGPALDDHGQPAPAHRRPQAGRGGGTERRTAGGAPPAGKQPPRRPDRTATSMRSCSTANPSKEGGQGCECERPIRTLDGEDGARSGAWTDQGTVAGEAEAVEVDPVRWGVVAPVGGAAVPGEVVPAPAPHNAVRPRSRTGRIVFTCTVVPYQSRHHSHTLPCMSYSPHAFGR